MNQCSALEKLSTHEQLQSMTATKRVEWALEHLPSQHVLSSSFGAQAAIMLHLVTQVAPGIPVIMIDTGYLFPETYQFADELADRLKLNLRVYSPMLSPAWQEARFGRRWEQGLDGIRQYNQDTKVEPMERALDELDAGTWFSGLRRQQSSSRANTELVRFDGKRYRCNPIADYSDRDVFVYLQAHGLPYHPLRDKGYLSIGDTHTTRSLSEVQSEEELRFFGLTRECGLHDRSRGRAG